MKSIFHQTEFTPKRSCFFAVEGPDGDYRAPEKKLEPRTAQELSDLAKNAEQVRAPEARAEQSVETEKPFEAEKIQKALRTSERPVNDLLNNRGEYGSENLASLQTIVLAEMKTPSAVENFAREQNAGELEQGLAGNREVVLRDLGNLGILT